jgi:thiol-disulfide isomerase/thioredoxin
MKHLVLILLIAIGLSHSLQAQEIPLYNFSEFEPFLHKENDSLYLVNFWATWCVPCIKEIPAINAVAKKYTNTKLKVLLVSLDMPNKIESNLKPFIEKKNIRSQVLLLDDPDFNGWIDKVDPTWSGAIPATLIYSKNSRSFYEQSFEFEDLDSIIQLKLNEL